MPLSPSQLATLKAHILSTPELNASPVTDDGAFAIATLLNQAFTPSFWVWRTAIPTEEIYSVTTGDATAWSWSIYIARSQGERDGWDVLTQAGTINAALVNTRQGVADIFSGAPGLAQRTHLLTLARRVASRAETLFAIGTGSTASPGTMTFEGLLSYQDVRQARALP